MLYQIGLEGGGIYPTVRPKPVQHIMELDGCRGTAVQKAGDSLPKYLDQANTPKGSASPLGNQDGCLPCYLLGQLPITECCLQYGEKILPVGGDRCVVPRGPMQPLAEVFC